MRLSSCPTYQSILGRCWTRADFRNGSIGSILACPHHVRVEGIQFGDGSGVRTGDLNCCRRTRRANQQKPVQPLLQKYSDSQKPQITFITLTVLSHWRGGSRSSRTRDRMRWTQGAPETRAFFLRTAKPCGPDAPTLASSPWEASFLGVTVARKPGHRGERGVSRKPLRGECRVIPV
jgi:hypothetical protein